MWLSNLFATRRELRRLAGSENFWRARAVSLEAEVKKLVGELKRSDQLRFEREALLLDRILTSSGKYAIADEAEYKVAAKDTVKQEADDALKAYLAVKQKQLLEDAREAKLSDQAAYDAFKQNEPMFIEDFQTANGF